MLPFHFGAPDRRLFGTFHAARVSGAKPAAVLLCNPFGQEAVRIHRLYRVLAERLARAGVDVLRFDYFGTGDSAGDDADGDFEGWVGDVLTADAELKRRTRGGTVAWLGARLGAAIAARATLRTERPPDVLVLWEPIFDGAAYLRTLAKATVDSIQKSLSIALPHWDALRDRGAPELMREGVGFELGERLLGQLQDLGSDGIPVPRALRSIVIHKDADPVVELLLQHWRRDGATAGDARQQYEFEWLSEEALNTALVPAGVVDFLASTMVTPP